MAKKIGKCKLCLEEKLLIGKSHIFPEFMYKQFNLFDENHKIWLQNLSASREINQRSSKHSTGIYDQYILCDACEGLIQKYEDYGEVTLFGGTKIKNAHLIKDNKMQNPNDNLTWIEIKNVDYIMFKLFLLSLIWRADISTHIFFSNVNLGEFGETIRKMIINKDAGEENEFPITLSSWSHDNTMPQNILVSPKRISKTDYEIYKFVFGGMVFIYHIRTTFPDKGIEIFTIKKDKIIVPLFPEGLGRQFLQSY